MKQNIKTLLFIPMVLLFSLPLWSHPLQTYDSEFNPALLTVGSTRKYLDMGLSLSASISNSYFSLNELFQDELTVDMNAIAADLNGADLQLALKADMDSFLTLTIGKISGGSYTTVDGILSTTIPNSLFEVMADGVGLDDSVDGTASIYSRVFATSGLYGGYRWRDWQFGTKMGGFYPIAYSDSEASYSYHLNLGSDGVITAESSYEIPFYTFADFENMNEYNSSSVGENIGYYMDFGAIKMKDDKSIYGFSLTGVTISPAIMNYKTTYTGSNTVQIDNLAGNYDENDEESWMTDSSEDPESTTTEGNYEVALPISLAGFYRLQGYPRFIDWIGHGGLTLDEEDLLVTAGISAQGASFPLDWFSLGLEYDRVMWLNTFGVKADLRVFELGLEVGLANTRLVKIFSPNGVYANLYLSAGF